MNYLLLIIFGLAPSFVWLLYFLRKDVHPEDNREVVKIFIYGALAVIPAALIQFGFFDLILPMTPGLIKTIISMVFGVAMTEEILKYLVVKNKVFITSHFDEPMDLPLYMIISSLGFAAVENTFVILNPGFLNLSPMRIVTVSLLRFLTATLLHALCSGTLGVFLAVAIYQTNIKTRLIISGFSVAIFLHALYNFSIMTVTGNLRLAIPSLILFNLALVLSLGFKKLKKLKSVCQVK